MCSLVLVSLTGNVREERQQKQSGLGGVTFEGVAFDDVVCDGTTMVDGNIPMLDPKRFIILLHIRKSSNIACPSILSKKAAGERGWVVVPVA
jgi:hypothetical protein